MAPEPLTAQAGGSVSREFPKGSAGLAGIARSAVVRARRGDSASISCPVGAASRQSPAGCTECRDDCAFHVDVSWGLCGGRPMPRKMRQVGVRKYSTDGSARRCESLGPMHSWRGGFARSAEVSTSVGTRTRRKPRQDIYRRMTRPLPGSDRRANYLNYRA